MRADRRVAAALLATLLVGGCAAGDGAAGGGPPSTPDTAVGAAAGAAEEEARAAARAFLDRYVEPDGRVARHDQGGDTVGESQSYGLVLAQVAGDHELAGRIWAWTAANLRRPVDGLVAHRWADGAVTDDDSASDADLLLAWALLRSEGPDARARRAAGDELAARLLDHAVVDTSAGPVLAAGQWATGEPASLNPSYWALPVLRDLAAATGDARWSALADAAVDVTSTLTDGGGLLPPDWARVDAGRARATPAPDGQVPEARYSLDAQRTVVWFALDGGTAADLAATWSALLAGPEEAGALALTPDGAVLRPERHPVALVAAAAAASAASDDAARDDLLDAAAALDADQPSYYGAAWIALGRTLLTTDLLIAGGTP